MTAPANVDEDAHTGGRRATPYASLGQAVGHTRFVVLIAVAAVLLVAVSLFLLGTLQAVTTVWHAWVETFRGDQAPHLPVEFLEVVIVMLEAVVFFLIGVGLYSLFIAPLIWLSLWAWRRSTTWRSVSSAWWSRCWQSLSCSTLSAGKNCWRRCSSAPR